MKILLGRVFLVVSFSFILLKNISFHYLMTFKFSAKIISWLSYGDSRFPIPFILSVAVHIFSCLQFLSQDFISLSSFWNPYNVNLVCLTLSQRSLKLSSFLFILFSLFLSSDLNHSVFKLTYLSSSFCIFIDTLQWIFHPSYYILPLFHCPLHFLLKTSCNFFLCSYILSLSSWIMFTIITLNSFLGKLNSFLGN